MKTTGIIAASAVGTIVLLGLLFVGFKFYLLVDNLNAVVGNTRGQIEEAVIDAAIKEACPVEEPEEAEEK